MIELLADLILGGLLVLTSGWCALLYRRLQRLRVERSDIETFMTAVDGAVRRAELAIAGIRDGACEAQRTVRERSARSVRRPGVGIAVWRHTLSSVQALR